MIGFVRRCTWGRKPEVKGGHSAKVAGVLVAAVLLAPLRLRAETGDQCGTASAEDVKQLCELVQGLQRRVAEVATLEPIS
jgi:hypothetical protein